MTSLGDKQLQDHERELHSKILHSWFACLKTASLYSPAHPSFRQSLQMMIHQLGEAFQHRVEIPLRITDGIFIIEDHLLIKESLSMFDLLSALETHKISEVIFLPGLNENELIQFLLSLMGKETEKNSGTPHLRIIKEEAFSRKKRKVSLIYEEWIDRADFIFSKLIDEQSLSIAELTEPFESLMESLQIDPGSCTRTTLFPPTGNLLSQHAVNSMIYAVTLGQRLGFDWPNIKSLGLSALLHDIGRLFLPSEFSTHYRIKEDDEEFIQLHAQEGASYLCGVPGLPTVTVRVALEHHLGYDGRGYPALPENYQPHFFSQIVALADFVSWRTASDHYYHKPITPYRLVRTLLGRSGNQFHPLLVKLLLPLFGLYPPGTLLQLKRGEDAVVLNPDPHNILRPTVIYHKATGSWERASLTQLSNVPGENFEFNIDHVKGHRDDLPGLETSQ